MSSTQQVEAPRYDASAAQLENNTPSSSTAPERPGVLGSRWTPLVLGTLTSALQSLVWRGFQGVPTITDEASYLVQAKLFAHFRWTAPPPPIRAFFEQMHVLISPVIASKYPPGHALLLAIGVFFGQPGLMPVVLTGLTAGMLFAVARRVSNAQVGLLAWFMWTCLPIQMILRPSYFSEATTAATFVVGWWALLRWRDDGRARWLVLLSVATAWCAITRPVTAVAYAVPTGAITLAMIWRRRAWKPALLALAAGVLVVAILPLWSWRTLGNVHTSPYVAYNQVYQPFEHLGFGDNGGRLPEWMPRDLYEQQAGYVKIHADYTPATMPREAMLRVKFFWGAYFGDALWSAILSAFIVVGVFVAGLEGIVAWATVVSLFVAHLWYAHASPWSIYYYESVPVLCFFAAIGVARVLAIGAPRGARLNAGALAAFTRKGLIAVTVVCIPFGLATQGAKRWHKAVMTAPQTYFAVSAARLPKKPAILFIRYAPDHQVHMSLINNDPDLAHADVWTVYDRGDAENARLRALAPERHAFLYDEASGKFVDLK